MITDQLKKVLKKNGIAINYDLDPDTTEQKQTVILESFENEGYNNVNKKLIDFLMYFNDMELLFINEFKLPDSMHFKLDRALKITYAIKTIEHDFDLKNIIPFGMLHREHMELIIDENDKVYATMDNILIHYGYDPFDALKNILNHNELDRIEI